MITIARLYLWKNNKNGAENSAQITRQFGYMTLLQPLGEISFLFYCLRY